MNQSTNYDFILQKGLNSPERRTKRIQLLLKKQRQMTQFFYKTIKQRYSTIESSQLKIEKKHLHSIQVKNNFIQKRVIKIKQLLRKVSQVQQKNKLLQLNKTKDFICFQKYQKRLQQSLERKVMTQRRKSQDITNKINFFMFKARKKKQDLDQKNARFYQSLHNTLIQKVKNVEQSKKHRYQSVGNKNQQILYVKIQKQKIDLQKEINKLNYICKKINKSEKNKILMIKQKKKENIEKEKKQYYRSQMHKILLENKQIQLYKKQKLIQKKLQNQGNKQIKKTKLLENKISFLNSLNQKKMQKQQTKYSSINQNMINKHNKILHDYLISKQKVEKQAEIQLNISKKFLQSTMKQKMKRILILKNIKNYKK